MHPPFADPALMKLVCLENKTYHRGEDFLLLTSQHDVCGEWLNMTRTPLLVHGVEYPSAEHLYQALRFPHHPQIQRGILRYCSPIIAKRWCSQFKNKGRPGWYDEKAWMMLWVLHVKLAQHYDRLGPILDATGNKLLLESSFDGVFWGVLPVQPWNSHGVLRGSNIYGQLLMLLRSEVRTRSREELMLVMPPPVDDFLLFAVQVGTIAITK